VFAGATVGAVVEEEGEHDGEVIAGHESVEVQVALISMITGVHHHTESLR